MDTAPLAMTESSLICRHLNWSKKQGRILTANGSAERLYTSDRGYPFNDDECPHFHLIAGITYATFERWKEDQKDLPIVGAWKRPLFHGGWEHSTSIDETVFNLQSRNLFIDMRIPTTRKYILPSNLRSLADMDGEQLRYFARQHVFAGFSKLGNEGERVYCTRHHCIDWNFVGTPRNRPNKWWIELQPDKAPVRAWKEWAFAKDDQDQHYYCERWESLPSSSPQPSVTLRKMNGRDGVLIIVGDHFSYILNRRVQTHTSYVSLVDLVDDAVDRGDNETARLWLGIEAGHGRVSKGWILDNCIEPWREGTRLWNAQSVSVCGEDINDCHVLWNDEEWELFDCNLESTHELACILRFTAPNPHYVSKL